MAVEMGYGGGVTVPAGASNIVGYFYEWTCDVPRNIHEVTSWETATSGLEHMGGAYHLTATVVCYFHGLTPDLVQHLVPAGTPTAGFILTRKAGATYSFSGLVSNINEVFRRAVDVPVQTLSIISSGAVVPAGTS